MLATPALASSIATDALEKVMKGVVVKCKE